MFSFLDKKYYGIVFISCHIVFLLFLQSKKKLSKFAKVVIFAKTYQTIMMYNCTCMYTVIYRTHLYGDDYDYYHVL
jgi:hypothetical protein